MNTVIRVGGAVLLRATEPRETSAQPMHLSSPAFEMNAFIPAQYTCDSDNVSPPLAWSDAPADTKSFALIIDDPDAPRGTWVHWVVWNIEPATTHTIEGTPPRGSTQGVNDFGTHAYGGPCPPSGTHRYFFKLYALDTMLDLPASADKGALERAMVEHILAHTELVGRYARR